MSIMYHDGNRKLQDRFDSRRIADRLEEKLTRVTFNDDDKALIESVAVFFIAPQMPVVGRIAHLKGARRVSCG